MKKETFNDPVIKVITLMPMCSVLAGSTENEYGHNEGGDLNPSDFE